MLSRLPWTPAPESKQASPRKRSMNRDRRRHFVEKIAAFMKAARDNGDAPTLLNFEGPFRHGLRVRLIGDGWRWQEADDMAADIVATALTRIGAARPTWEEGQPEYSQNGAGALIERTRCVRCHRGLPEQHTKYCSDICAGADFQIHRRIRLAKEVKAYDLIVNPGGHRQWL